MVLICPTCLKDTSYRTETKPRIVTKDGVGSEKIVFEYEETSVYSTCCNSPLMLEEIVHQNNKNYKEALVLARPFQVISAEPPTQSFKTLVERIQHAFENGEDFNFMADDIETLQCTVQTLEACKQHAENINEYAHSMRDIGEADEIIEKVNPLLGILSKQVR